MVQLSRQSLAPGSPAPVRSSEAKPEGRALAKAAERELSLALPSTEEALRQAEAPAPEEASPALPSKEQEQEQAQAPARAFAQPLSSKAAG